MLRGALGSLATVALLAGCGGGDSTTVVQPQTTPTDSSSTAPEATDPAAPPAGPSGELLADGIGDVTQGASPSEVEESFGEPVRTDQFPGCELDPEASPVVQFTYDLPGGALTINFDARTNEMTSYRTDSPALETSLGDAVGDGFSELKEHWGASLEPLVLGSEQPSSEVGTWVVTDGPRSQLLFSIDRGEIAAIQGGYLPPCE